MVFLSMDNDRVFHKIERVTNKKYGCVPRSSMTTEPKFLALVHKALIKLNRFIDYCKTVGGSDTFLYKLKQITDDKDQWDSYQDLSTADINNINKLEMNCRLITD
jgi:hypothetical protein